MTYHVHGVSASGNCYKVRLALEQLNLPYAWHEVDMMHGATRTDEFKKLNPNGKVPVLCIDETTTLSESDAILCYLADGTPLMPDDRLQRAQVLQWMFFEQYSHEPYVAVARFILQFLKQSDDPRLPDKTAGSYRALDVMEQHLATRTFLVAERYTVADIALFAYTHVADEAGLDLSRYPSIRAWLDRVRSQPRHVAMPGVDA
ncbi:MULTISPECIES: glutathione S-transferase family protein [unclassified Caballeronia]|uniref:glutathione S-transferase family protein n=1 Tax=unclassified Caballeronia TaxID=2646786 RepID=UPI0028566AC6|nr:MULTISPECIES: glutathione S-transferase family protein [unclassified Caballeronia]MDR5736929.1 glutathione S-transferase family protein [Caballeronia sp. LZ016]MDR5810539.1 glutathione S-transferase family protein [Caballeronia sp. LZ019]